MITGDLRRITVFTVVVALQCALASGQDSSVLERNKRLAQQYHFEVIAKQNLKLADEIFTSDCTIHTPSSKPTDIKGPERAKREALHVVETYSQRSFIHDTVVAEGNLVAFRWRIDAGVFLKSGERAMFEGIDIVRIENGKIAEIWSKYHRVTGP
jgi:predicted SnoaL-like aldol condensation-catalyzing enzyme